ncbi:MAG: hypothetical protein ABR964_02870 [Tepidisphaeraceae bacterium]|jgi:hypothetical protein
MTAADIPAPPVNPVRRSVRITAAVLKFFVLVAVLGLIAAMVSRFAGGAALLAIGFVAAGAGAFGAVITLFILLSYRKLARQADEILAGTQVLGRWRCTEEEWMRHIQTERRLAKKSFRGLLLILGVSLLILIGVCVYVARTSDTPIPRGVWLIVAAIFAGVMGLLAGIGYLAATLPVRRLKHPDNREIFVGRDGLILAGKFVSWKLYFAQLEWVRYEPGDPGFLDFRWIQPGAGLYGLPAPQGARVPVPRNLESVARQIVGIFAAKFQG